MYNKPMLSVERDTLEWVLNCWPKEQKGNVQEVIPSRVKELRAILDRPVECLCRRYGKDNPHWPCPIHSQPSAQHQGEPVELDERVLYDAWRGSNLGYVRPFNKYEWSAWKARARIAEQPAPVAVVLPEHTMRSVMEAYAAARKDHLTGTSNFCAAMAARLNGV